MRNLFKMKKLIISTAIVLMVFGAYAFNVIPKQENPDLSVPYSIITIEAPGMNKDEIDSEIVMSFQSDFAGFEDLNLVKVSTYDNYSLMIVGFEIGVDNFEELNYKLVEIVSSKSFGDNVDISIDSDFENVDILYAFDIDDYKKVSEIKEELITLSEVKTVEISSYEKDFYMLQLDNSMLNLYGLSISDIIGVIQNDGLDFTLGYIDNNAIITSNSYTDINSLESTVIASNELGVIKISDVGSVNLITDKSYVNTYNGVDSMYLSIQFKSEIDITKYGNEIRDIVDKHEILNEIYFAPDDVDAALGEINSTLVIGMILVLITVLIGLGLRSALTILITFPFTVLSTIFTLYFIGYDLQKISIAGLIISIGIIVDNSIVVLDAINANLEDEFDMDESVEIAIKKNSIPILTSTLTTIVAFTPLLFLPGVAGQMAFTLPLVVIIALVYSYINAVLIIPILAKKFIKKRKIKSQGRFINLVTKILKYSKTVVVLSFLFLVISVTLLVKMRPINLFPSAEKDFIIVDYTNLSSGSIEDANELGNEIIKYIDSDEILLANNYSIPSFYSTLPTNFKTPNSGRILYKHSGNNVEEIDRLTSILESEVDDAYYDIREIQLNEPGAPIVIQLYDLEKLDQVLTDLNDDKMIASTSTPSLNLGVNYVVSFKDMYLLEHNILKSEITTYIALSLNEHDLDVVNINEVDSNLKVVSNVDSIEDLISSTITINGVTHELKNIVEISEEISPVLIPRYMFRESQEISVEVEEGYSVYTANERVVEILSDNDIQKSDYEITGEVKLTNDVFASILDAAMIALFTILLILLIQFREYKKILIIGSAILLSLIGTSLLIVITKQDITFSVLLGVVSLMGIVVNNGILLIDYIVKDKSVKVYDKCVNAVKKRTRAIVISNVTTIIGLIPLIIFGDDFFRPMAIALVGGLTLAVPLSIIVVPALYMLTHKEEKNEKNI